MYKTPIDLSYQQWFEAKKSNQFTDVYSDLDSIFELSKLPNWPNASGLNELKVRLGVDLVKSFVSQSELTDNPHYYEEIIYLDNVIPTRDNSWHDLFNGLIWLLFPQTKQLLNRLHYQDIENFGVSPRTKMRNQLTHFDECGLIIVSDEPYIFEQLNRHQWIEVFVKKRQCWGQGTEAFMFGHANLEMSFNPFIGFTGKWVGINSDSKLQKMTGLSKYHYLDQLLAEQLSIKGFFQQQKPFRPIPILGVPGWWEENENSDFYLNDDYFRPLKSLKQ